jgi:hypothetical protein
VLTEELCELRHQHDRATTAVALDVGKAAVAAELLAHADEPVREVNIGPPEAENLTEAEPGEDADRDQSAERARLAGGLEQLRDLLLGEDPLFLAAELRPLALVEPPSRVRVDEPAPLGDARAGGQR